MITTHAAVIVIVITIIAANFVVMQRKSTLWRPAFCGSSQVAVPENMYSPEKIVIIIIIIIAISTWQYYTLIIIIIVFVNIFMATSPATLAMTMMIVRKGEDQDG